MNTLKPQPPFVWPEPRITEEMSTYERQPPFDHLGLTSRSLFGIVSAMTSKGVEVIESWLEENPNLKVRLIVVVYPACATRQADLSRLSDIVERMIDRLSIHIRPLERTADRGANALCFLALDSGAVQLVTGPSEDLGLETCPAGCVNFVCRPGPVLVEAFRRYFDWLWFNSREITASGVTLIPELVLSEGTEEGARLWRAYRSECVDGLSLHEAPPAVAHVDIFTGDVTIGSQDSQRVPTPSEELGLEKLDQLAEQVARLYEKGALVSIDKLSRIPPLDAPLDPSLFGDAPELHKGNVTRRVSMRVSIIDEKTLREIEKCRKSFRTLLTKFTFGLADNMRWMPDTARELLELELNRINEEGQKLISDLLKGDVGAFIEGKRDTLVADINAMFEVLGRPGPVTNDVIDGVVDSLKNRLKIASTTNFMPKLSFSIISFAGAENDLVSPWGQAYSLLADVAAFPRKALTDSFFFRGVKVAEEDVIEVMNIADDALLQDLSTLGIKDRCKAELALLAEIESASMKSRDRCEMVWRVIAGDPV